jgi:hypothetical protein
MTTYKKYSITNRKTRKIKLFNGGAAENDIKTVAVDKVKESVSNGKKGGTDDSIKNTAIEKVKESLTVKPGGKQVSILIDFYKKLLKPEDYGKKLDNFNKFYETININKNGINMTESITGVEELFKIFNNELEYIKATDADKENKKKALSENHTKRKAVIIDYGDNGEFTINGEKGAVAPPASGRGAAPVTGPEDSIKESAKSAVATSVDTINSIQDAAINELKSNIEKANIDKLDAEIYKKISTNLNELIMDDMYSPIVDFSLSEIKQKPNNESKQADMMKLLERILYRLELLLKDKKDKKDKKGATIIETNIKKIKKKIKKLQ